MKFEICCAVCGIYLGKYAGGEFLLLPLAVPVCPTCYSIIAEDFPEVAI
jgi:hypothetical protein